jgi:YQGE family putative transporter
MDAFFLPFYIVQLTSATFNVINQAHEEKLRIEYMINRDIVLNSGRIISTGILIFMLVVFKNSFALKFYLLFMGAASLIAGSILKKLNYINNES